MNISSSTQKTTLDKVVPALTVGKEIATAMDTVLDREFIEKYRNDWCWVGNADTPTETGWYKVDRELQCLVKISDDQVSHLAWHERLFVYQSALAAMKEDSHLALYIGGTYNDGRVEALYLCGPDYLAWVAQK